MIDAYLDSILSNYQIPGIGVGICSNSEIIYQSVRGKADIAQGNALKPDFVFPMASVSKVFSATAVMQLVQEKALNLSDSIVNYLPDFQPNDSRYSKVNLQYILSHTSGIEDLLDYEWMNAQYDEESANRYLQSIADIALQAEPGCNYIYSNRAYNILGALIKSATHITFEAYAKAHIFKPLGMEDTTFLYPEVNPEKRVSPHTISKNFKARLRRVYPYNRIHAPSTTLHSTIPDMLNWIRAWLNGGNFNGHQLLKRDGYNQMLLPHVETDKDSYMCLGWKLIVRNGLSLYVSVGGDPGFRSFMIIVPEKKIGVVVVINADIISAENIAINLLMLFMERNYQLPRPSVFIKLGQWIVENGLEAALEKYDELKRTHADEYDFSPDHLVSLAYMLLHKSNLSHAAITLFNKSLAEDPGQWRAYNGIADANMRLGNVQDGVAYYQKSLSINFNNPVAINGLKTATV